MDPLKTTSPFSPHPQAVADAAHLNWHHALSTALALLPPTFTEAVSTVCELNKERNTCNGQGAARVLRCLAPQRMLLPLRNHPSTILNACAPPHQAAVARPCGCDL